MMLKEIFAIVRIFPDAKLTILLMIYALKLKTPLRPPQQKRRKASIQQAKYHIKTMVRLRDVVCHTERANKFMNCKKCPLNKTICPRYDYCPHDVYKEVKKELEKHPPVLKAVRNGMPTGRAQRRGNSPNAPGAGKIICYYPRPCGNRLNLVCQLTEKYERWKR